MFDSEFKIDKDVRVTRPDYSACGPKGCWKYPFDKMGVGDSFFVAGAVGKDRDTLRSSASSRGKRHGMKFTTRTVTEDGVKGVRIWRVA